MVNEMSLDNTLNIQFNESQLTLQYDISESTATPIKDSKGEKKQRLHLKCLESETTYDIAIKTLSIAEQFKVRQKGLGFWKSLFWAKLEVGDEIVLVNIRSVMKRMGLNRKAFDASLKAGGLISSLVSKTYIQQIYTNLKGETNKASWVEAVENGRLSSKQALALTLIENIDFGIVKDMTSEQIDQLIRKHANTYKIGKQAKDFLTERFSNEDIKNLTDYIEENYQSWSEDPTLTVNRHIRRQDSGLVRDLLIIRGENQQISIHIIFNKNKEDQSLAGEGTFKRVKRSMDLASGDRPSRISMPESIQENPNFAEDEIGFFKMGEDLKGVPHIRHNSVVHYINKKGKKKVSFLQDYYSQDMFVRISDMLTNYKLLTSTEQKLLVSTLLEAFAGLQSKGILHRDLKPDNILVDLGEDGRARKFAVTDLGLSCKVEDREKKRIAVGTVHYCSPEYCKGVIEGKDMSELTTFKHDAWGLGIVLLMATHNNLNWGSQSYFPSWLDKNMGEVLNHIAYLQPSEWIPEPKNRNCIEHIIWEMLRLDPKDRIDCSTALDKFSKLL